MAKFKLSKQPTYIPKVQDRNISDWGVKIPAVFVNALTLAWRPSTISVKDSGELFIVDPVTVLISKTVPTGRISNTRNDFRIASLLARYPFRKLQKIGLWAIWREMITYKAFRDSRVLDLVLKRLEAFSPMTRNDARPLLKAVSARLQKIDTTVLSDKELSVKLKEVLK